MKLIVAAAMTLALSTPLAACGEDKPAVCSSVASLKSSVNDVKKIDVSSSTALSDLESAVKAIASDVSDVKANAKAEYGTQADAVQSGYDALIASIDAAKASTSAATLTAAKTALSSFGTSVQTLVTDVKETC
jgi:soluble cytochrome b562